MMLKPAINCTRGEEFTTFEAQIKIKTIVMKRSLIAFALMIFTGSAALAQIGGPEISFEKKVHDFGDIEYAGNGACEFVFTNTGTEPLIISNAKGSCGCTVPEWPKQPIAPGASAAIKVKYDTKRPGPFTKSVTLTSNASNAASEMLKIKGKVAAKPAQENASPVNKTMAPVSGGSN